MTNSESLRIYRNPGGDLRGVIFVARESQPTVRVETFPAVTVEFDDDDQVFVASCECFDLVGTGRTDAGALHELKKTLRVFLAELLDRHHLFDTLDQKGWVRIDVGGPEDYDNVGRLLAESAAIAGMQTPRVIVGSLGEGSVG